MMIVVGSGPTGVSCAQGLLEKGEEVTLLDAGLTLEPDRQVHVHRLATSGPENWPEPSLAVIRNRVDASPAGVPLKYVFGSDFTYREPPHADPLTQINTKALRSFAQGGLSQAWGATVLPYCSDDIVDWPLTVEDLAPHYRAALNTMPFSAAHDDLSEAFPLYAEKFNDLRLSAQAQSIWSDLQASREALRADNWRYGKARLALQGSENGCRYCGFCLYGCPYDKIYCAAQTLTELRNHPKFHYVGETLVKRVRESAGGVRVEAVHSDTGEPRPFDGKRVFLACGVLGTTQLLLESLGRSNEILAVQTSQAFLFPLFRYQAEEGVSTENLYTLSQIYLHLRDPRISRYTIQLQIYTYNDLMPLALKKSFQKFFLTLFSFLQPRLLRHLVIIQGFLHSSDSDPLAWETQSSASNHLRHTLRGKISPATRRRVWRVARRFFRARSYLKAVPLFPWVTLSAPGQSFHTGGSFAMSKNPGCFQTDLAGRPTGFSRVHAVDTSVLPTIPATTVTLTAMANARRIAHLACE